MSFLKALQLINIFLFYNFILSTTTRRWGLVCFFTYNTLKKDKIFHHWEYLSLFTERFCTYICTYIVWCTYVVHIFVFDAVDYIHNIISMSWDSSKWWEDKIMCSHMCPSRLGRGWCARWYTSCRTSWRSCSPRSTRPSRPGWRDEIKVCGVI